MCDQRNVPVGCRPSRNGFPVWLLAAAGTSLALLLAGCGTSAPNSDARATGVSAASSNAVSTPLPGDGPMEPADAVRWLDGFCGAVNDFMADNNARRVPTNVSGRDDGRQVISTMLGDYAAILSKAIDHLAALPPGPDSVGQTAKQTFMENYTSARDTASSAKAQLDAASPANIDAQMRAAEAMVAAQQRALSAVSPEVATMTSPELRAALASAHRCTATS
jgi:hypothetical protein